MSARTVEYSPKIRIIDKRLRMANRNTGIAIAASTVTLPSFGEKRYEDILLEHKKFFIREKHVTFFEHAWREVFVTISLKLHLFKKDILIPPFHLFPLAAFYSYEYSLQIE
jgi:hypothetical protein